MNFSFVKLSAISLLVFLMTSSAAMATIINFTVEGTYAETLTDQQGNTLYEVGDSFVIQGQIDDTLQPQVELKSGSCTYQDQFIYTYSLDYSKIVSISYTNLSLSAINDAYSSDEDAFNADDLKTGSYLVQQYINYFGTESESATFEEAIDYTSLIIQSSNGVYSGWLDYNHRVETTTNGDFTLVQAKHDTVELTITSFIIESAVPVPGTGILLATGLICVAGDELQIL